MGQLKKKQVPLYLELEKYAQIKKLSEKTRVPIQVYLREGVDMILAKYLEGGEK